MAVHNVESASHRATCKAPASVMVPTSPVGDIVARPAVRIHPEASLADAVGRMTEANVSSLLLEGGAGIITERDLARAFGAGVDASEPVRAAATPTPVYVSGRTTVMAATAIMLNEEVRHLVVDLPDGATGVISLRDAAAVLLQSADPHIWLSSLRVTIGSPAEIWLG